MPCSGLTLGAADGTNLLARTLDFDQNPGVYLMAIPRKWPLLPNFTTTQPVESAYAQIAMGLHMAPLTLTLDGVNEHGLCGADFYYPGCAHYEGESEGRIPLGPSMAMQYALATCRNLDDVADMFQNRVCLIDDKSPLLGVTPPLHFFFTDPSGEAMVVEPDGGMPTIHRDTVGVLTNAPDYRWQATNLRNYIGINREPTPVVNMGPCRVSPISPNAALWGMPGDYTSVSRFVRTAWLKQFIQQPLDEQQGVTAAFHVLSALNVPHFNVGTDQAEAGYTMYTAVMSASSRSYYFHTYDNNRIQALCLDSVNLDAAEISVYRWDLEQDMHWR